MRVDWSHESERSDGCVWGALSAVECVFSCRCLTMHWCSPEPTMKPAQQGVENGSGRGKFCLFGGAEEFGLDKKWETWCRGSWSSDSFALLCFAFVCPVRQPASHSHCQLLLLCAASADGAVLLIHRLSGCGCGCGSGCHAQCTAVQMQQVWRRPF